MSVRRSVNARTHTIPADAVWIEFERTDGDSSSWPKGQEEVVDEEGCVNFMRPMSPDESQAILWRKGVGKFTAQATGRPAGKEYVLRSWPEGYQLFDHNKGPASAPRHDLYLYGSIHALRFRSANEFAPHALWLMTDPTLNPKNCQCKYCAKKPQREITQQVIKSGSPSPTVHRHEKRITREAREAASKGPHAALRRAPQPLRRRLTGPTQWEVPEKSNDIRDALGQRETRAIRYFRQGEVIWCSINPPILLPGSQGDGITFWPGVVDRVKTESEIPESASRPASPGFRAPTPEIAWRVRQHTAYTVKFLATAHSDTLSEEEVLPYLAWVPSDNLLSMLRSELPRTLETTAVKELNDQEQKMFAFNPTAKGDDMTRWTHAIAPYILAMQIASKMTSYWTPTDEWECKFTVPITPPTSPSPPKPDEAQPSLHSLINSAMAHNARMPGSGDTNEVTPDDGVSSRDYTATRTKGVWWGVERIWTDELVRLKLARAQFMPQGSDVVQSPGEPGESSLKTNAGSAAPLDNKQMGAGEKGLFMMLEGLFVVDVPQPDGSGVVKECRGSGMLYELVDADWQDPASESEQKNSNATLDVNASQPLSCASANGTPIPPPTGPAAPLNGNINSQLSHPVVSTPLLPDPPKGYKFRPILAPGHEVVLSLSLISGRYYPHLMQHPLLQPELQHTFALAQMNEGFLHQSDRLWALEGLVPGMYQSMEPKYWRGGRHIMLRDATVEAKHEVREALKSGPEIEMPPAYEEQDPNSVSQDVVTNDSAIDPQLLGAAPSVSAA